MPSEGGTRPRILVAGVGNVLHGDDGFGVEVAKQLIKRTDLPESVKVIETGIGGMSLVQELMYGYDALAIVDAYKNNRAPGDVYLLEPVLPDLSELDEPVLDDHQILLCRVDNAFFALDSGCAQDGSSMDGATLSGFTLSCPSHSACLYDVRQGTRIGASAGIECYPVKITADGPVMVGIDMDFIPDLPTF